MQSQGKGLKKEKETDKEKCMKCDLKEMQLVNSLSVSKYFHDCFI